MSSSWDLDVKPSYDCLEVWDSFGELQLMLDSVSRDAFIKPRGEVARPPVVAFAVSPIATAPRAGGGTLSSSARKASSQKTSSREKPVSIKKEKAPSKKVKSEVPQLLMEFPNKNN
jgi:hypothetical protein